MTQDEIIRMAREAGATQLMSPTKYERLGLMGNETIERFFNLAFAAGAAHEREKQANQEPVAWFTDDYKDDRSATTYDKKVVERWEAKGWPLYSLYAAPVRTKDLTPHEITALIRDGAADGGWQGFAQRVIVADRKLNGVEK